MAYYGMRKPYVAKYNKEAGTYSDGFKFGKAVKMDITPNYVEGSLYGDDEQAEYENAFQNANVTLGTTTAPIQAAYTVYGHTIDSTTNLVTYKTTDEANNTGVGWIAVEVVDGVRSYIAVILTCVKFKEAQESFQTKGDSITFATPSQEGLAIGDKNGAWKIKKVFDTAEAAESYIKTYLNITDPTYTYTPVTPTFEYQAVTPVGTENPTTEGWYERSGEAGSYVYTLSSDTTVDSEKTYYEKVYTQNPKSLGWYERSGSSEPYTYTLTEDTTVNTSKTYYTRSSS